MPNIKKFLTHNQQMKYLRTDKNILCKGSKDKEILSRIGYFNLVNGYKEPFVAAEVGGIHTYYSGTSIRELYSVKKFDDELRILLLQNITKIEEEIRNVAAYKFDEVNGKGKIEWYQVNAYDSAQNTRRVVEVISRAYNEIDRSKHEYVRYYLEHHSYIPTWIMIKVIQFSLFINFLNFSKPSVKKAVASLYGIFDGRGVPDFKLLIGSLHWIRTVRNSCAHNERVFMINQPDSRIHSDYMNTLSPSYSRERDRKIIDLLIYMKYFLPDDEYRVLMNKVHSLLSELQGSINVHSFEWVRGALGVKDIKHINQLLNIPKATPINYNKISSL
jgi:abortive infection bacteriophage resistance protein